MNTPPQALANGVGLCFPNLTQAVSDLVPGHDERLQARADRITADSLDTSTAGGGPYCQEVVPAFAGQVPDGDDTQVNLATDPRTPGQDYEGFDRELWRASFIVDWKLSAGTLTSWTGYTNDDNTETQDSGAFGISGPAPYLDSNVNSFSFVNDKETEQFSQEIRFASDLDGSWNYTVGLLYWEEDVDNTSTSITTQVSGSHCLWNSRTGNALVPTLCSGYTEAPYAPYQNAAFGFREGSPANRETEHWSVYGMLDWDIAEDWTLTLEGRYNDEEVEVEGPVAYDTAASGGPGGLNPCGIFFRPCQPFDEWIADGNFFADSFDPIDEPEILDRISPVCLATDPDGVQRSVQFGPADDVNGDGEPDGIDTFNPWCVDSLEDDDDWFSPKITLDWRPTAESMVYASWSRARKPGGFSLLTVGSNFLDREITEFDPEEMEVWEIGGNSTWLDGTLLTTGAIFFQDFTDKQALTSTLGNDGRLVSKIENAGAAEVWGAELGVTWQPEERFLGGRWTLSGSYTWLDTEYTDFEVQSGSPVTAAAAGNCRPVTVDTADGPESLCVVSYTGNELEDAPEGAFVGFAGYAVPVTDAWEVYVETDLQWQDQRFTGVTNNVWVDSFWSLDFRVGLESDNWDIQAYVENVFEDDTVRFTGGGPGLNCCFILGSAIDGVGVEPEDTTVMVDLPLYSTAFRPDPRLIGIRARYRFGGAR